MSEIPRLFLITPPIAEAAAVLPCLEAALDAADVACVLLRMAVRDDSGAKAIVRAIAPLVQGRGAAMLLANDARLAARAGADGVHVDQIGPTLDDALASLKPDKIVGVGGLSNRDAAMTAGEGGVDYLMFGAPGGREDHAAVVEQVAWWAEIFNVPCVGYVRRPEDAGDVARAGAEFVALGEGIWDDPSDTAAALRSVTRALEEAARAVVA